MGKLKPFEKKETTWAGLWWNADTNSFTSRAISLADLRIFKGNVRLVVRKNKFFNNGENGRPNYCFCLRDANSPSFQTLDVKDEPETVEDSLQEKVDELAEILRDARTNADRGGLPSESNARALWLFDRAIEIIEEITGEKWEFSYVSW